MAISQEVQEPVHREADTKALELVDKNAALNSGELPQTEREKALADAKAAAHVKPEGVPDKYWKADTGVVDYASWNKEMEYLQKKASGQPTEEAKPKEGDIKAPEAKADGDEKKAEDADKADEQKLEKIPAEKFDHYTNELQETGDLSDESYTELAKFGFDRGQVQVYLAGVKSIQKAATDAAFETAGGEDQFKAMMGWFAQNGTEAERKAYNEAINDLNPAKVKIAVAGMRASYEKVHGTEGSIVDGGAPTNQSLGFKNQSEMVAAINDPRYNKDRDYTREVRERVARTTF